MVCQNKIDLIQFLYDELGVSPMTHQFDSYSSGMTHFETYFERAKGKMNNE